MVVRADSNDGLVSHGDGLWTLQFHRHTRVVHMRARMSIIRLGGGGLLLYSPVPIDDTLARELATMGPVEHIVAPNCFHHLFAGAAQRRYAHARLWAVPGLPQKRADLSFAGVLGGDDATDVMAHPFGDDVELVHVAGMPAVNECVIFHRPSRSLICCDFVMNIHDEESFLTGCFYRAYGVWRRAAQSRGWQHWTKDRARARQAVQRVLSWDAQRLVMAHGELIDDTLGDDTREVLARATAWLCAPRA